MGYARSTIKYTSFKIQFVKFAQSILIETCNGGKSAMFFQSLFCYNQDNITSITWIANENKRPRKAPFKHNIKYDISNMNCVGC